MARKKRTVDCNWHWKPTRGGKQATIKMIQNSEVKCWHCGNVGMTIGWVVSHMAWVARCTSCGVTGNSSEAGARACAVANTQPKVEG